MSKYGILLPLMFYVYTMVVFYYCSNCLLIGKSHHLACGFLSERGLHGLINSHKLGIQRYDWRSTKASR